jgi:hypothetical protein
MVGECTIYDTFDSYGCQHKVSSVGNYIPQDLEYTLTIPVKTVSRIALASAQEEKRYMLDRFAACRLSVRDIVLMVQDFTAKAWFRGKGEGLPKPFTLKPLSL